MNTILRDIQEKRGWFGDAGKAECGNIFVNDKHGVEVWDMSIGIGDYAACGKYVERKTAKNLADNMKDKAYPSRRKGKAPRPTEWDSFLLRITQAVQWVGRKNFRIVMDCKREDIFKVYPRSRIGIAATRCKLLILESIVDVVWAGSVDNAELETMKFLFGDTK